MSWSLHIRNFRQPGVAQNTVTASQCAYVSVLELPFRLRLGKFLRQPVGKGSSIEIVVLNRIDLPTLSGYKTESLPLAKDRAITNSRLCLIEYGAPAGDASINQIRKAQPFDLTTQVSMTLAKSPGPQLLSFPNHERLLGIINRLIGLYFKHCPARYQEDNVRPIWLDDFYSKSIVFGICLHYEGQQLPNRFVRTLLQSENPKLEEHDIGVAFLHDASNIEKRRLLKAIREDKQPAFSDQLLLLSHSFQAQHNVEMAVVTAVAAVEAAMSSFANSRLGAALNLEKGLVDQLLREHGAHVLTRALPLLFFKDVPEGDVLAGVKKAIEARNKIMHGKTDKTGQPSHLNMGHLGRANRACRVLALAFQRESN